MDNVTRDLIAEALRSTIDELVADHYNAMTQEHKLSSRIGQRLEDKISSFDIFGHDINIISQDIPDKGRGSLEKKVGVDLFVSVELKGAGSFSKAVLVQSKWNYNVAKRDFQSQCGKMLNIYKSSYVWIYGPTGVKVLNASDVRDFEGKHINPLRGVNIGTTIKAILDCNEGDPLLGIKDGPNRRERLTAQLKEFGARTGVDVEIVPDLPDVPQRTRRGV